MPRVPKPTMSQDGYLRIPMSVQFRISIHGLVGAAILEYGEGFRDAINRDEPRPRVTRGGVMEALRGALHAGGSNELEFAPYDQNYGDDVETEIETAVRAIFPEFEQEADRG